MKKGIRKLLILFLLINLSLVVLKFNSFAAFSNPIEIKGRHIVENDETLLSGRHVFVLTSVDNAPMPEGSKSGVKKVTINSNETFNFGEISYDAPGLYKYTVSREISESNYLEQDNSEYRCTVQVMNDGLAVVIFEKIGTSGKPNAIVYTDKYITPGGKGKEVGTGDNNSFVYYCVSFLSVLFILVVMSVDRVGIHIKRRN